MTKNLTLRNIPDDLYRRLQASAEGNKRSINNEILAFLEKALGGRPIDPPQFLQEVRRLRERCSGAPLTDQEIESARRVGRP